MSPAVKDLLIALAIAVTFGLGWLTGLGSGVRPPDGPTTCPALGVVTINDAIAIVRECEDGRIIRDYPWEEDHATDTR